MSPVSRDMNYISNEEYLVTRAKEALKTDACAAKVLMITAKTLFPSNFGVQFEAYIIEKSALNVKEAAKCFSEIFKKFQDETELWGEVQALTASLRPDCRDPDANFRREMFECIPREVQHQLLLVTADRSEDTMEHCRLILLLLRRFPHTIERYGPRLVDTLMTAEKHSHYQNSVNCYRKLLVCDLLPVLGSGPVDLPVKQLLRLLHKSIEFYMCYLMSPNRVIQDLPELECKIEDPWKDMFNILEITGRKLGWELTAIFGHSWNKESYWVKMFNFKQTRPMPSEDHPNHKQLLYCTNTFFLYCLHEYTTSLNCGGVDGLPLVLVEAFVTEAIAGDPRPKRRKTDPDELTCPVVTLATSAGSQPPAVVQNFQVALRCWDLLHSTDSLQREFVKLSQHLKLDSWLHGFLLDTALYKGRFDEALSKLQEQGSQGGLKWHLRLASALYSRKEYARALDHIVQVVHALPVASPCSTALQPQLNNALQRPSASNRHVHYLTLSRTHILQYCVKLLLSALKQQSISNPGLDKDLAIGHMVTLLQFDWPLEEELATQLLDRVRQCGSFSYGLFQGYVVNVDLLEEFVYLTTEQGGGVTLDVVPSSQLSRWARNADCTLCWVVSRARDGMPCASSGLCDYSQRRISTRGADKGVREDFKQAMKRQVARSDEPLDNLIISFLTNQKDLLLESLK